MSDKYTELRMEGISIYADKIIAKDDRVYLGSCFGGAESVQAALAGLVSGKAWNTPERQYSRAEANYNMRSRKVAGGLVHGMAFIPTLFDVRQGVKPINVVFGDNLESVYGRVFSLIKKRSAIPLLDCWQDMILKNTVSFVEMETFGIELAYEVELPEDSILEEFVISEIKILKTIEAELWKKTQNIIM